MELKRLGLTHKNCYVVPNHLTEQWSKEFMTLYPSANILVASKSDLTPQNRKKFIDKIAFGEFDAVIIGHSSFKKIPVTKERKLKFIKEQVNDVLDAIKEAKESDDSNFLIKKLEAKKKQLEVKLKLMVEKGIKDEVLNFEQLGVDGLFVDEAHEFKNLFLTTKLSNVAGVPSTSSEKSTDMFLKTQYINEISNNRATVLATGTPISNSMTVRP